MIRSDMSRRSILALGGAALLTVRLPGRAHAQTGTAGAISVMKDANCGCCADWVDILRANGFDVDVTNVDPVTLRQYKIDSGLPAGVISCHTATVQGYVVEGHVPVADIRRLLDERPDAIGLAVPGMPYGSPGMGPETERDAYDVLLIKADGTTEIFSRYASA